MRTELLLFLVVVAATTCANASAPQEQFLAAPCRSAEESGIEEYYNKFQSWAKNAYHQVKDWAVRQTERFTQEGDSDEPKINSSESTAENLITAEESAATKERLQKLIADMAEIDRLIQTEIEKRQKQEENGRRKLLA